VAKRFAKAASFRFSRTAAKALPVESAPRRATGGAWGGRGETLDPGFSSQWSEPPTTDPGGRKRSNGKKAAEKRPCLRSRRATPVDSKILKWYKTMPPLFMPERPTWTKSGSKSVVQPEDPQCVRSSCLCKEQGVSTIGLGAVRSSCFASGGGRNRQYSDDGVARARQVRVGAWGLLRGWRRERRAPGSCTRKSGTW